MSGHDDILGMSDEDFLKTNAADYANLVSEDNTQEAHTEEVDEVPAQTEQVEAGTQSTDEGDGDVDSDDEPQPGHADQGTEQVPANQAPEQQAQATESNIDYKAEYEKLMAPFKANGKEVQAKSADDAMQLMQMGANYNKKMAALKPSMKVLKMLEANGLLDEGKISYLIELDKKDPGAINKLVSDSGIDPLDFDTTKASEYQPKSHAVDERDLALDTVLEEIQSTPTYTRTMDTVIKKWDGKSKNIIADHPELLKVINAQMQNGIFDLISNEVERERMFGRLTDVSELEAYKIVGDAIEARGGFNHLTGQGANQGKPKVIRPNANAQTTAQVNDKKRAASASQQSFTGNANSDLNPLAMSDEDFMKMAAPKYR